MTAFLILGLFFSLKAQGSSSLHFRGVWVIRHNITSPEKIKKMVRFASQYGFTDIFVQIRGRGDAYYNSELVPKTELISDSDFDPLEMVIKEAHDRGIRVHAWMNVYFLWSAKDPPVSPRHLLYRHPDWIATNSDGLSDFQQDWRELIRNGFEGIYLSPVNPEVNKYLCSVIEEVVNKYDVDGIHLDYIRFQSVDYGYNKVAREIFRGKYGIDPILLTIADKSLFNGWDSLQFNLAKKEWNQFRKDGVTSLVRMVRKMILDQKPSVFLSAATKADIHAAREFYLQDWISWAKERILDFAVPMNYASEDVDFEKNLKMIRKELPDFPVYMGIGAYNQDRYSAASKIVLTKKYNFKGVVIFSYDTYLKSKPMFDLLYQAIRQ